MVFSPLVPFPYPNAVITNITPVTYRDASTFLEKLEILKRWINDYVIDGVNDSHAALVETVAEGIANAEATVLAAKAGWQAEFDAYMVDVNASLMALNDAAMSDLIELHTSQTFGSLDTGFVRRIPATTLYVNPAAGDDDNGGGAVAPLATVSEAIRRAELNANTTEWIIQLAAGTYTERVTASAYTPHRFKVVIQGPEVASPSIPAVVFTEGNNGVSAAAMKFENPNAHWVIKYVKFRGYNGTTSSAGINNAHGFLETVNVHAEECFYGVSSIKGNMVVPDGVFTNCGRTSAGTGNGAGIRSLMLNRHSIGQQGAGTRVGGPIFTLCRYGFYAQESSTGHVDWSTFTGNETGVVLRVNSRGNLDGSAFDNNLTDIAQDGSSHAYISDAVEFGAGVNQSDETVYRTAGSSNTTSRAVAGRDLAYERSERVLAGEYEAVTVTGNTAVNNVADYTLSAPWWNDTRRRSGTAVKRVKIRAVGTLTGAAGTKQITLRLGDKTANVTFSATEEGAFTYDATVIFASPTRQIIDVKASRHLAETPRAVVTTTSQDMSTNTSLLFQTTLANAADSVTWEYVELVHG